MSNYLFFAGKDEIVKSLENNFILNHEATEEEVSFYKHTQQLSFCVIERRQPSIKSSIHHHSNNSGVYFRGQALDHESSSMILGTNGFSEFQKENIEYLEPSRIADFEGSFVLSRWSDKELTFQSDLFSMYRLLYFASDEILIVSDSLVLIVECMKHLKINREINNDVALVKAWNASGLPNAPFSKELIVKKVFTLQVGKHIKMTWDNDKINVICVERSVKEIFSISQEPYEKMIRKCAIRMFSSIDFVVKSFNPIIEFGLSGGIDSRVLLALCLRSKDIMNSLIINTNKSPTRINDYNVVAKLSQIYGFKFNDSENRNKLINSKKIKKFNIKNKLGFWKLSALGTYDSFYQTTHYYDYPGIISMVGVGAEPVKQYMDSSKINNLAKSQHPLVRDAVARLLTQTIGEMGIDPNSSEAMKWYHMSYKAAYHLGYKITQSSMILRPFVQKSIFKISLLPDNPFKGSGIKGPTVLHDILIMLNPELAYELYDSESKNITKEYANERLMLLGGVLSMEELMSPKIFGNIKEIANGPANTFMSVVKDFEWETKEPFKVQLIEYVKDIYLNKMPSNELKEIYQSCFERTIEHLENEKFELGAAGALASRFLAFTLFEN